MIDAARNALASDADLIPEGEQEAIRAAVAALERSAAGVDADAIAAANEALSAATENLAMLRMNRSVRAALAGARIDDVLAAAAPRA